MMTVDVMLSRPRTKRSTQTADNSVMPTEAAILAMPEDDYMGNVQLAFFKSRLLMLEQILVAHARSADVAISNSAAGADPIDRASAEEEHTIALTGRARDAAQLLTIRAALRRIEQGEFGYCLESGEPIGVERLLICPTAVYTKDVQERLESRARHFRIQG
jgi:DnaK suppressor protein